VTKRVEERLPVARLWRGSEGLPAAAVDAEPAAVEQTLAFIESTVANSPHVASVVTDSTTAIHRLRNTGPGPGQGVAKRVEERLARLWRGGKRVSIKWVKGHSGVAGNEAADAAAKAARQAEEKTVTQTYLRDRTQREFRRKTSRSAKPDLRVRSEAAELSTGAGTEGAGCSSQSAQDGTRADGGLPQTDQKETNVLLQLRCSREGHEGTLSPKVQEV